MTTRSLIDPLHGFDKWWRTLPPSPRKVGKPWCKKEWVRRNLASEASHIITYTEWRSEQDDWPQFMPMPKTFINAAGWIDWEPPTAKPKPKDWLQEYAEHEKKAVPMPKHLRSK